MYIGLYKTPNKALSDERCEFAARYDPRAVHARDEIINALRSALREE